MAYEEKKYPKFEDYDFSGCREIIGDTLSQIVYDYNQANGTHLTVDEVAALSGIENPVLIHSGQGSDPAMTEPSSTGSARNSANPGAEKLAEETDKLEKSYSDYKINEMASFYLPENERVQQMFEPGNMFWKMVETGVKQWFRRLPL